MTIIDIPTPEVQTTRTIDLAPLIKARLRTVGWRQHAYGPSEGPNCVMGASGRVIRALTGYEIAKADDAEFGDTFDRICALEDEVKSRLTQALGINPLGFSDVEEWNDDYGRTVEEVFALLDSADLKVAVYE